MRIVVTGGAGFLGGLVIDRLLELSDTDPDRLGALQITEVVSLDLVPSPSTDARVRSVVGDLSDPAVIADALRPDDQAVPTVGVVHLAAVLSGQSEVDFDLSAAVNVDGTRALLEAVRQLPNSGAHPWGSAPRFVFTSSLAVFGGAVPQTVPETWAAQPDSTYGAMKAIGELLVNEYSRRGFVDGRVCRLPTISVRPGRPNSAASSFASGIIREPLHGEASVVPVPLETRMWLSSPRMAVENLVHALLIPRDQLGRWRVMNIPGISVSVADMLAALHRVAGPQVRALVTEQRDPAVEAIVCSWPGDFDVDRLLALGFQRDEDFDAIVQQYVRDHVR